MEVAGQVRSIQLGSSVSNKRKKLDSGDSILLPKSSLLNDDSLPNQCCSSGLDSPKISVSPTTTFEFPDQVPLKEPISSSTSSDLKADENCGTHQDSVPPSNVFRSDNNKEEIMESPGIKKKRKISQASSVDAAEIEEFFSVAEKFEMERFMEKYNYDIVKDVALEGRYQWVCLKPSHKRSQS